MSASWWLFVQLHPRHDPCTSLSRDTAAPADSILAYTALPACLAWIQWTRMLDAWQDTAHGVAAPAVPQRAQQFSGQEDSSPD